MHTIIESEHYNALYIDGTRSQEGKPEYLDGETMARLFPDAEVYWVPDDVYEAALSGAGYPARLADFPLASCRKVR